jgi:hypothetical protein
VEPLCGFFERRSTEPAAHGSARLVARQQAGVGEHSDVLHDIGQRHRERLCQLADAQARRLRQPQQDRATRRICESRERAIELGGLKANHVVKYCDVAEYVKGLVRERLERGRSG